jgi:ABC-2 type transport system permease protein
VSTTTERGGRYIRGPGALNDDPRRFWQLTFTIAKNEFRLRFFGSALGYAWQLMRPLLLFGVLYIVFTKIIKVGEQVPHFPAVLLGDVVLMTFFGESTMGSVRSVVDREALVRKIQFPRLAIPLSIVLTSMFNLGMNLVVVAIFALAQGVRPHVGLLVAPLVLILLISLAAGFAMLLSSLFVRFRDLQPIWEVVNQILFYACPVIYPIQRLTEKHRILGLPEHTFMHIYMCNPLAVVLVQFCHSVMGAGPSAASAAGGWAWMAIPLSLTVVILALGFTVFHFSARHIAEDI